MKKLITIEKLVDELEDYLIESSNHKRVCQILFHYNNKLGDKLKSWMFLPCGSDGTVLEKPTYNSDKEIEFQAKYDRFNKAEKRVLFKNVKTTDTGGYHIDMVFLFDVVDNEFTSRKDIVAELVDNRYEHEFELTEAGIKYFYNEE